MIPMDFSAPVMPGSFEFALCHLVDRELDLSAICERFCNDVGGALVLDQAVLRKVVLLGYSRGLSRSRAMAVACAHNSCSWRCRPTANRTSFPSPLRVRP